MVRIAPVKLASSSKALWFDTSAVDTAKGHEVVVQTARGMEFGRVSDAPFEATKEQLSTLKSALKPVCRIATPEDVETAARLEQLGRDAMPDYRRLVEEEGLDMRPISVEYLFEGDKAIFYFESEDRVDFRDLVRKLASRFHVHVDMRQIGVRDEARMVGGLGHCGQELCCKRLGGEFCPVSIRMAKEQDLSLNPQKISGICGRLMCCLRYEYDAYKDFKSRAPKVGAAVTTPEGAGKVVSLDVPQEIVTIQVSPDKKVKIPLADMDKSDDSAARSNVVGEEAWERANEQEELSIFGEATFVTSQFTATDKLGEAKAIRHENPNKQQKSSRATSEKTQQRSSGRSSKAAAQEEAPVISRKPRRRSTKLAGGVAITETAEERVAAQPQKREERPVEKKARPAAKPAVEQDAAGEKEASSSRRRRRRSGASKRPATEAVEAPKQQSKPKQEEGAPKSELRPGHRSSSLRRAEKSKQENVADKTISRKEVEQNASAAPAEERSASQRRRRRRRRSGSGGNAGENTQAGE